MVKVRRNSYKIRKVKKNFARRLTSASIINKKEEIMMSIASVLMWSFALFHLMNCCDLVLAGDVIEANEGDEGMDLGYGGPIMQDTPFYDWSPNPASFRENKQWVSRVSPYMLKSKRAAFGILQLATKRPHKTASEIQYMPPQDSFMSVRGRKKRSLMMIHSQLSPKPSPFDTRRRNASISRQLVKAGYGTNYIEE